MLLDTTMRLIERLEACLQLETLAEEIYLKLCTLFPDESKLFQLLAEEEARHADILTISVGFNRINELPDEIVPDSAVQIRKAINIAQRIKQRLDETTVSFSEALDMSLELETSMAENYFNEMMKKKMNNEIISYLQRFYKDEESHADRIKKLLLRQ